jgi:enoyl-CoA hydratase
MAEYGSFIVERAGPVLTIKMLTLRDALTKQPPADIHRELGLFLDELRHDTTWQVRLIVLTGAIDGEFAVVPTETHYDLPVTKSRLNNPRGQWVTTMGVIHTLHAMTELEIPIIAKVNGDAIGYGQSLMFGCDLIIARSDARISDIHMAMGDVRTPDGSKRMGPPFGVVPGDGAGALLPLFMSPPLAKEYLMLSPVKTAAELAQMGAINYAVPAAELDITTDRIVSALLARPPYALGWTKRIVNRRVVDQLNLTLDASAAYEMINFLHLNAGDGAPPGIPTAEPQESNP